MKVLVPVKRVVDYNVKVRVKADGSGVDLASGAMLYEIFTGELSASWDSRIRVVPMFQDWQIKKFLERQAIAVLK